MTAAKAHLFTLTSQSPEDRSFVRVCCCKAFGKWSHQGWSSGGDEADKRPFWPMSLVIDHLLEHAQEEGHLRAGETFLWPRIRKSKGFRDLWDPALVWVAPKNRLYCNDTWMFHSPIYLGMTILIELSHCWSLSCWVENTWNYIERESQRVKTAGLKVECKTHRSSAACRPLSGQRFQGAAGLIRAWMIILRSLDLAEVSQANTLCAQLCLLP